LVQRNIGNPRKGKPSEPAGFGSASTVSKQIIILAIGHFDGGHQIPIKTITQPREHGGGSEAHRHGPQELVQRQARKIDALLGEVKSLKLEQARTRQSKERLFHFFQISFERHQQAGSSFMLGQ